MMEDKVKPKHYESSNDVIKFCLDNNVGFCEGNVIKYVRRWREKNGVEDLLKAKEYLGRLIEYELSQREVSANKPINPNIDQ